MGKLCAVFGCGTHSGSKNGIATFKFPDKPLNVRRAWINFVKTTRKNFSVPTSYNVVCALHFMPDCFEDQYTLSVRLEAGYAPRRRLKADAIPTLLTEKCKEALARSRAPSKSAKTVDPRPADTSRYKRCVQREAMKSLHAFQNAAPSTSTTYTQSQDTGLETIDTDLAQSPNSNDTVQEPATAKTTANFSAAETSTSRQISQGCMANLKPTRRSRGVSTNIQLKSVAVQCDLLTHCPCHCVEATNGPTWCSTPEHNSQEYLCEEMEMDYGGGHDKSDLTFLPDSDSEEEIEEEFVSGPTLLPGNIQSSTHQDRKYIVFQSALLELFTSCPLCGKNGDVVTKELGTLFCVTFTCSECAHHFTWKSQPTIGSMPVGNLLLSAATLFTGSLPSKVFHLLDAMNVARFSHTTFFKHQRYYIQPIIISHWEKQQQEFLKQLSSLDGGLVLAGDGRSDSPGHCAKFGGFNAIECRINKVVDVQIVQSNEVGNSARCENEGLRRTFAFLKSANCAVDVIITDRHKQNEKFLRQEHPDVKHYFDVWHVAKGLTKKLTNLARTGGMEKVGTWRKSIINHLYWVAASTPSGDGQEMLAKWESLLNHIIDKHEGHGDLFPACLHGPLENEERMKDWFTPDSNEFLALSNILESRYLTKDIQKLSPLYQTSALESFHSLIIKFCPKHTAFSYMGMYCRILLAAMHYNENSEREHLVDKEGRQKVAVCFPKSKKGEYSVRKLRENPTYNYVSQITEDLFNNFEDNPSAIHDLLPTRFLDVPDPLAAQYPHPTKEEAIATYTSRFCIPDM